MPELDHLVFASRDLTEGVDHIAKLTSVTAEPGGPHPGAGSHNALLGFDRSEHFEAAYFEIIAIDPDQPAPTRPRPFGLDALTEPRLVGFAVHTSEGETIEEVVESMRTLGHDPGPIAGMSRTKPDGTELSWHLTRGATVEGAAPRGVVPFVIDWGSSPSPALTLAPMGRLLGLVVAHPNQAVRSVIDGLCIPGVTTIDGPSQLVATVDTPKGNVELR